LKRDGCKVGYAKVNNRCIKIPESRIVRKKDLAGMPPMVARVGGKTKLKKTLRGYVPEHNVYVEPFVGGGTLYWDKPLAQKNIINDMDPALIKFYKDVKNGKTKDIKACRLPTTKKEFEQAKQQRQRDGTYKDPCDYLRVIKRSYGGRGNIFNMPPQESRPNANKYKSTARIHRMIHNADMYHDKLKKTSVSRRDFCDAMKKHDSRDTFHYLDPPYWDTNEKYNQKKIHPQNVVACASKMKGKVLVSYDDVGEVKKAFRGWKKKRVKTKYEMQSSGSLAGVKKDKTELLIMNYDPRSGKRLKIPRVAG